MPLTPPPRPRRVPFSRIGNPSLSTRITIKEAMDRLKERGVKNDYCPRCEHLDWNVDIVEIPGRSAITTAVFPVLAPDNPQYLSLLAVVCRNCGYTMFHNLDILGISVE